MSKEYRSLKGVLFHTLDEKQTLEQLASFREGISDEEAQNRTGFYGSNELKEGKKKTLVEMFLEQFKNIMIIVLLIAAAISGFTHELTDALIILAVVLINAILGVAQESKAEKALSALKSMSSPFAKIKRNGEIRQIKSSELVPGDIVSLEAGDFVPADMRLLHSSSLKIEEAALTGESVPVEKTVEIIERKDIVIGDRKNMAWSGSSVTYGRGIGVVTATGMDTEVGRIAGHISGQDTDMTPLQKKMHELSKFLTVGILVISVIIFIAGVLQGREILDMSLVAISLAVAAIPEGLPAVITIVLALGVQKMARRNAIIRKLSAVETLGSTQIICSDKTGTLTQNKMTVKEVYLDGSIIKADEMLDHENHLFMHSLVLCNDSSISHGTGDRISFVGDPTETALTAFALDKGFNKAELDRVIPRIGELPFDSDRKLMSSINEIEEITRVFTKGAPDVLLGRCTRIFESGCVVSMTEAHMESLKRANGEMAGKALRVLGFAYKDIDSLPDKLTTENLENNLIFIGLTGMIDPPRPEAAEAVRVCSLAGIRPIMITGDHRDTAAAIAVELKIISSSDEVITGSELDALDDTYFENNVDKYSVYARVSPEHKVKIVKAWKKRGKIVAMTGDGVNDAPALKAADIGVGMGITGTDVSKGVADMVLSDDNFATIVLAVEEGRKIYSNLRKAIQFLLSTNLGEVITLFVGTMLSWIVLMPIHILWVNLVTDTLPALALGMEKTEKDIMKQKPRKANSSFFSGGVGISVLIQGILAGCITLAAYYTGLNLYSPEIATTMAFATLGLIQLSQSLNVRSVKKSIFKVGVFTNPWLNCAIVIAAILQAGVIVVPFFNDIFNVVPLNMTQWLIVIAASISIIPIVELIKLGAWLYRKLRRQAGTTAKQA